MGKHILAVDDNDDILNIIEVAFEHEGFQVKATHSHGEMCVEMAQTLPDLIILDLMLPGVNGYQVIEQLHHDTRTCAIPIIVITAKSEQVYRRISADMGAAHHLIKPFHPDELVAQARAVLAHTPVGPV